MADQHPSGPSDTPRELNVLITGAAGGMCRGINKRLGKAGHTLLCVDLDLERCQAAVEELRAEGITAHAFAADVTRPDDVERLRNDVKDAVGEVHALINAAGILDRKMLLDHDMDSFSRAININLVGPFALIRAFAEDLHRRKLGPDRQCFIHRRDDRLSLSQLRSFQGRPLKSHTLVARGFLGHRDHR